MDPRHPQHPFSRSNGPPFSHAPFQQTQSQAPFPPSSHAPNGPPAYQEHHRRPSDGQPYYTVPAAYPRDQAPIPASNHSRHHSSSSVGQAAAPPRNMLPPSSPQQQHQQHAQHSQSQHANQYPAPSLSRGPPAPLGTPLSYPGGRDLPSILNMNRPGSVNSSMSISSMLGGPAPPARESAPPQSQYAPPPSMTTASGPPPGYAHSVHASPRLSNSAALEYEPFRRPRTPEHRPHETVVRDHRANSAGSPPRGNILTPETQRYSTPQAYQPRHLAGPNRPPVEERREPSVPNRVPNPNALPPRPSSQPTYNGPPPRGEPQRVFNEARQEPLYGVSLGYLEREREELIYRERERERIRMEEDAALRRERERRERDLGYSGPQASGHAHENSGFGRQYGQTQAPYGSPHDSRDPNGWNRRPETQAPDQSQLSGAPPATSAYEYSRPPAQTYAGRPEERYASQESRYPPSSYGAAPPPQPIPASGPQYGSPPEERRSAHLQHQQPSAYQNAPPPAGPLMYRQQESPRKSTEDLQQPQQRGYLGVQQDVNRGGRRSPLPQAVQGAQGPGPGSEPGIKNEFGKMFGGIGSGVGGLGTPGGGSAGAQTPFSNPGPLRRDDLDSVVMQEASSENGGHKLARSNSRGGSGSRRRRLKDEGPEDDSSTGRRTPSGRKRAKPTNSHRQGTSHRYDIDPPSPSQAGGAVFKPVQPVNNQINEPKPVLHHHHINRHHHHHNHSVPQPKTTYVPIPKPKQIVRSQAVLDSVSKLRRAHLGHMIYETKIVPADDPDVNPYHPTGRGFRSKSEPLPRFEGKENCTYTVRVPRFHLEDSSREEITAGRAVWGTDVYTDDSDVIAACIHGGWVRGAWPKEVDVSLLGLEVEPKSNETHKKGKRNRDGSRSDSLGNGVAEKLEDMTLTDPPLLGPMSPPLEHDLHVTILILPALEKYASTVRFGIKSREWEGNHDGLSYMIHSLRWVRGVGMVNEANGEGRRTRMKLRVEEDGQEENERITEEQRWGGLLNHGNGHVGDEVLTERLTQESFERGAPTPLQGVKALGKQSWWKETPVRRKRIPKPSPDIEEELRKQQERDAEAEKQRASEEAAVTGLAGLSEAAALESASNASNISGGGRSFNGNGTPIPMQNEAGQWRTGSASAAPTSAPPDAVQPAGPGEEQRASRDAMIVS